MACVISDFTSLINILALKVFKSFKSYHYSDFKCDMYIHSVHSLNICNIHLIIKIYISFSTHANRIK